MREGYVFGLIKNHLSFLYAAVGAAFFVAPLGVHAMSSTSQIDTVQRLDTQPLMIRKGSGKQVFFTVEVADDIGEQRTGLMYRTALDAGEGMIFLYDQPRVIGMWMKNTLIPLDMIFMDQAGRVVNVHAQAEPGSLTSIRSRGLSVAVLEIKGGDAQALGLQAGDQVFHCHFGNFPCETTPAEAVPD
ncbi:MAG: DUF192 domain-containing protein [Pseudomonadota bacterium]